MKKIFLFSLLIILAQKNFSQPQLGQLTVEKIMRDPKWIGASPANPYWGSNSDSLFFYWNPDNKNADSLYYITAGNLQPHKATAIQRRDVVSNDFIVYNNKRTAYTYSKSGDLFLFDIKSNVVKRITYTADIETNPSFIVNDSKIVYTKNQNLFSWEITSGITEQLTKFERGTAPIRDPKEVLNEQEQWLKNNQLENFEVLKLRKLKRDSAEAYIKNQPKPKELKSIYYQDKILSQINISPDGRFVTYRLIKPVTNSKATIVPNYVTESGFTQDIPGRTKVGAPLGTSEFYIFDTQRDTAFQVKTDQITGIDDKPDYVKDYPQKKDTANKKKREVTFNGPYWNENGTQGVVEIYSQDNKDRWLMLLYPATGKMKLLDRQRDEAWVGGPEGFTRFNNLQRWIDENTFWYLSEASGYSHLYKINVITGAKTQLTTGQYEVQSVMLSSTKKYFYITTNEINPGEKQFYKMSTNGGAHERITTMTGSNMVTISPDEKQIAVLYSYSNKPWELFIQPNKLGAKAQQVTNKAMSDEFKSYPWRDPEIVTFAAADGATVYGRLYPAKNLKAGGPAVIFVHGAGYLQNAHKWWSSYFREYMFNNLLADNGYSVIDIDYRGSAGYGRDWRTGIYRFMGGKDLDDNVDAAKYLTQKLGVDPKRIGLYGGSYGGFITLMAMFTKPDVFAAGAGLRCVTDWAHYNDGYTSNILNNPYDDSIAYKKSSPLYYAEGLKGSLLMCHGMVDVNVHFQDIVRLTQRLIELHKQNWELAVYPMEDHGFVEPSSWTDEYSRIFKLFESNLKK